MVELTKDMIDSGAQLIKALDTQGLAADAAFWIYSPDTETWKPSGLWKLRLKH